MIHAVGINTKQNNQENINIFWGGWKARGIPKGGFGCVLARKAKKVKSFRRLEGPALAVTSWNIRCFLNPGLSVGVRTI